MNVIDFMVSTGSLSKYNYVIVKDTDDAVSELKAMGCTDSEIEAMRKDMSAHNDDGLDVWPALSKKGYLYHPGRGFFKAD